jgi:hypothetical protein
MVSHSPETCHTLARRALVAKDAAADVYPAEELVPCGYVTASSALFGRSGSPIAHVAVI